MDAPRTFCLYSIRKIYQLVPIKINVAKNSCEPLDFKGGI